MDKKSRTLVTVLAVVNSVALVAAVMLFMDRSPKGRESAPAGERKRTTRSDLAAAGKRASEQERKTAILHPGETPICSDSDADRGDDAIFVRGRVRTSEAEVTDHCRLAQLVEFSCIENPPGSGRFVPDAKLVDCPDGGSCDEGACLRSGVAAKPLVPELF